MPRPCHPEGLLAPCFGTAEHCVSGNLRGRKDGEQMDKQTGSGVLVIYRESICDVFAHLESLQARFCIQTQVRGLRGRHAGHFPQRQPLPMPALFQPTPGGARILPRTA